MTDTAQPKLNPAVAIADRFAGQLLRASLDAMQAQRTLWPITPQHEQQQTIDTLRTSFYNTIVRHMVDVAAAGFANASVTLANITAKGDSIKASVTIGDNKTLHDLVDRLGQKIVLVLVDAEVYTAGMESFEAMKDQPDLPLEGGSGAPPNVPVSCSCSAQSYDDSARHEPDCEYLAWRKRQGEKGHGGEDTAS